MSKVDIRTLGSGESPDSAAVTSALGTSTTWAPVAVAKEPEQSNPPATEAAELTPAINNSTRTPVKKGVMEEGSDRKGLSSTTEVFQTVRTSRVLFLEEPLTGDECQSILDITDDEVHRGDAPKKVQQSRRKAGKK
jgi:hypothetical protein